MGKRVCDIENCVDQVLARGLCSMHYQQARIAGRLDEIAPNPSTTCEQCGQLIPAGRRYGAKFCSVSCKDAASDARKYAVLVASRAARVTSCAWCKEELSEKRYGARYCSLACGDAWHNHQKALSAQRAKEAARQPCEVCGDLIPATRPANSIYCSLECKRHSQRSNHPTVSHATREYNRQYKYGISPEEFDAMLAAQGGGCAICGTTEWMGNGKVPHVDHDHATGRIRGILCGNCNLGIGKLGDDPVRLRAAAAYLEREPGQLTLFPWPSQPITPPALLHWAVAVVCDCLAVAPEAGRSSGVPGGD